MNNLLCINEMFYSLEGETVTAGFSSFFIRLGGCNLDCFYCDTEQARVYSRDIQIGEIVAEVKRNEPFHHVTVTGGEPLLQQNTIILLRELIACGYMVQMETNGSISFENLPEDVRIIADVKTPSSGEAGSFLMSNIKFLKKNDEVKFVISSIADYEFSKEFMKTHLHSTSAVIDFSPVYGTMEPSELVKLIVHDKLNVRLNLQLHKIASFD